ncbi:MAG TPA: PSD1 and planctomycete cytochrome C domain-containing protein [Humisphaera sp.]
MQSAAEMLEASRGGTVLCPGPCLRTDETRGRGRRSRAVPPASRWLTVLAIAWFASATRPAAAAQPPTRPSGPRFATEILPVLSDNCFSCHGPDEKNRKAGLRLDTREGATKPNEDGTRAIVPGDSAKSELIRRIITDDADELMPPPKSHRNRLTAAQVQMLRQWIDAGATWGKHWAFEPPAKPPVPPGTPAGTGPVDAFVRARLAAEGLAMSPPAKPHTQLRRLSFDLTGLPPTPEQVRAFERDPSSAAYDREVDQLLASPHFGERMAMWWLDAARYADTDGFQSDDTRTNWPWRDWVIKSFNENKPFDRFTLEQFAGDTIPKATAEQVLATCFHRNHMTNGEGGRDPEESRVDYVLDRVNTTGTVWLGLTLGCAQCHSHKFDPVTQADYYALSAFFNSVDEDGKAGKAAKPYLAYQSTLAGPAVAEAQALVDARKAAEAAARAAAGPAFEAWLAKQTAAVAGGHESWHPVTGGHLESSEGTVLTMDAGGVVVASGPNPNQDDYRVVAPVALSRVTGLRLEVLPHESNPGGGLSRGKAKVFVLTDIKVQVRRKGSSQVRDVAVASAAADAQSDTKKHGGYGAVKDTLDDDPRNGWTNHDAPPTEPRVAVFALAEPLELGADEELVFELRHRSTLGDGNIGRFRLSATDERGSAVTGVGPTPLAALAAAGGKADAKLRARLQDQFLADHAPYVVVKAALDKANRQLDEAKKAAGKVDVMVLAERKQPRDTFVLVRGVWDKHGDKVRPDAPQAVLPWPDDLPRDRAGLARWLCSPQNPLTARVIVNHLWQLCFGAGLVRTPEDFGLQGERPTHPDLLDWLAVELVESGWDVKHVLKLIVTSDAYRQRSDVTEALLAKDPENRLLARGPRYRLPSWMLRDAALTYAGLLNPTLGGPPVRPYQPPGVWEEMFMGRFKYEPSDGPAQYRRTVYAFWRRAIAPTFLFDSAQRRVCEVRTARTNTPLQALALLNDASYLEASRALAATAVGESADDAGRVTAVFRRVLSREPTPRERDVVLKQVEKARTYYAAHPADAAKLLTVGQGDVDPKLDRPTVAAYMTAASMVLNLDEAITHE